MKFKKIIPMSFLFIIIFSLSAPFVSASTSQATLKRGVNIAYCKTHLTWQYKYVKGRGAVMTSSNAYQTVGGILVSKGGVTRTIANRDEHLWSCRTKFLAGGTFMGIKLGSTFTWDDKAYLYPANNYYFKMQPASALTRWIFS